MPPKYELKAKERIRKGIQKYSAVLQRKQQQGINEEDTSVIVHTMLAELLGYEQFSEITGQHKVKGHFVDWAVTIDGEPRFFVEVKALGARLRERDLLQVTSYSRGKINLNWAVLTNGAVWQCHRVASTAETEQFFEVRILDSDQPANEKTSRLYLLSREATVRDALEKEWSRAECYRPESLAPILLKAEVVKVVRRLIRRERRGRRVEIDGIREALVRGVIRADVYERITAASAQRAAARVRRKLGQPAPGDGGGALPPSGAGRLG